MVGGALGSPEGLDLPQVRTGKLAFWSLWLFELLSWFLIFFNIYFVFIYLAALGLSCGMRTFGCGMWDLAP